VSLWSAERDRLSWQRGLPGTVLDKQLLLLLLLLLLKVVLKLYLLQLLHLP
jgi:hypothetical protein